MTTVSLVDLSKKYTQEAMDETAVTNLNLTIRDGELLVLLGPSGCGKSTTLRLIAGLLKPTDGNLKFDGQSVLDTPPEKRGTVMVFQQHALFPFMTVGENVAFGLKMQKLGRKVIEQRVDEMLTAVQLQNFENRRPDQLSGGERQRVALARALAVRPKLLLLDEPLSSLDRSLREELRGMIRNLQKQAGITTVFVTHDQAEAVAIADRIGLMFNGRLRQIGSPQDFYQNPADEEVARFFGGSNFLRGTKMGQLVKTEIGMVETAVCDIVDGPVLLTIRPELVEIGANGHNNFRAQLHTHSYHGTVSHCQFTLNGVQINATTPPHCSIKPGNEAVIHLPRERICLLPVTTHDQ